MTEEPSFESAPVARLVPAPSRWLTLLVTLPCAGALLGFLVGVVCAYVAPKTYESATVVQIHGPMPALWPTGELTGARGAQDTEGFWETEREVIQSAETLKRVADRLGLSSRWNGMDPDTVILVLKSILKTEQIRDTELIEIRVRHQSAQDARDIANELTMAYKERRQSLTRGRANEALNALDREIRSQEDLVEEKRKLFHTIVKAVGIPYVEGLPGSGVMGRTAEELMQDAHRERAKLEREKRAKEIEIKTLLRLNNEELLDYVVQDGRAPEITKLWQKSKDLRVELTMKREELGEEDGKVRGLVRGLELLDKELKDAVVAYQEKLQTDLTLTEYRLQKMKEIAQERRFDAVDKALQSQDYVEAKVDYENSKKMLLDMKKHHVAQRIALKLPFDVVTIHESPRIGKSPVGPSVNRYITLGLLIGAGFGLVLALPISGLLLSRETGKRTPPPLGD